MKQNKGSLWGGHPSSTSVKVGLVLKLGLHMASLSCRADYGTHEVRSMHEIEGSYNVMHGLSDLQERSQ